MKGINYAAFLFFLVILANSIEGTPIEGSVIPKQFPALSLFSVVQYPNEECTTGKDNSVKGICMNSDECTQKGGTSDGNCASGFGMCCKITLTACGGTVNQNITYVRNSRWPNGENTATAATCEYKITAIASSPAICQVRLDFATFAIKQPTTKGTCSSDTITFKSPSGNGVALPKLCGTLTDQHMYIESGGSSPAAEFTIKTSAVLDETRKWSIKVSQIPCHTKWTAMPDCLQYHTGRSGTFRSFNHPTGTIIRNQLYQVCIRLEQGACSIMYRGNQVKSSVPAFDLNPETTTGKTLRTKRGRQNCPNAQIQIHGDQENGPVICGGNFAEKKDAEEPGVVYSYHSPNGVLVYIGDKLATGTDIDHLGDTGFSLQYVQLGCGHRISHT